MTANLFRFEEHLRVLSSLLLVAYAVNYQNWWLIPIALFILYTGIFRFCPLYRVLGINHQQFEFNSVLSVLPKHNPEPVFIFSKNGSLIFRNDSAKKILPSLTSLDDLQNQDHNNHFIAAFKGNIRGFVENDKCYLLHYKTIPGQGTVVAYGFNVTELMQANDEIVNTQKELLYHMGEIGETRSKETGNHVKRVAEYSRLLAQLAGLDSEQANLLKLASPMHDIGKVAIPDHVLLKPGKLDAEEWEIMKTHASIGHDLLKHSSRPILKAAAIVAGQHHEKWNGSGYPQGLQGEQIHIYGRITALADVYDALASDRVYKKAWPLEEVIQLISDERGQHFDPQLVDLFLANQQQFNKIRLQYNDESVQ